MQRLDSFKYSLKVRNVLFSPLVTNNELLEGRTEIWKFSNVVLVLPVVKWLYVKLYSSDWQLLVRTLKQKVLCSAWIRFQKAFRLRQIVRLGRSPGELRQSPELLVQKWVHKTSGKIYWFLKQKDPLRRQLTRCLEFDHFWINEWFELKIYQFMDRRSLDALERDPVYDMLWWFIPLNFIAHRTKPSIR